jgi:hypothetical protein
LEILLAHQFFALINGRLISVIEIAKRFGIHFNCFALRLCGFAALLLCGFAALLWFAVCFAVCFATLLFAVGSANKIKER